MNIQWTPNGANTNATLGDDPSKYTVVVEKIGGQSIVQPEPLAGGANPALFARGNVSGQFVFRSSKSYADYQTTWNQWKTEYGRLNQQGVLLLTEGVIITTITNAICRAVERIFDGQNTGTRMGIRYTFEITTIQ